MFIGVMCLFLALALGSEPDGYDEVHFSAIRPGDPGSEGDTLQLKCTFDRSESDIIKMESMYVRYGDDILGMVKKTGTTNYFDDAYMSVSGHVSDQGTSDIEITWAKSSDGYDRKYTCVATGNDVTTMSIYYYKELTVKRASPPSKKKAEPLSSELTGKIDQCLASCEAVEHNTDLLDDLAEQVEEVAALTKESKKYGEELNVLKEEVSDLSNKQNIVQKNVENLSALEVQVSNLKADVNKEAQDCQNDKLKIELLAKNQDLFADALVKVLSINTLKYDVSSLYGEHIYIASKKNLDFNLQEMNDLCKASSGYLAEIGDKEELKFVGHFVEGISKAVYAIGGNDVESEGNFVYYNSKEPVPGDVWKKGEPNNSGNEDCVQITSAGLNDIRCNRQWRYVCEIPLV